MKKVLGLVFTSLVLVLGLSATDSFGQSKPRRGNINKQQQKQQKRIAQGVRSGELTAQEVFRLEREQAKINRVEDRFRDSGDGLSRKERLKLEKALNKSSRDIYKQKHDDQNYPKP